MRKDIKLSTPPISLRKNIQGILAKYDQVRSLWRNVIGDRSAIKNIRQIVMPADTKLEAYRAKELTDDEIVVIIENYEREFYCTRSSEQENSQSFDALKAIRREIVFYQDQYCLLNPTAIIQKSLDNVESHDVDCKDSLKVRYTEHKTSSDHKVEVGKNPVAYLPPLRLGKNKTEIPAAVFGHHIAPFFEGDIKSFARVSQVSRHWHQLFKPHSPEQQLLPSLALSVYFSPYFLQDGRIVILHNYLLKIWNPKFRRWDAELHINLAHAHALRYAAPQSNQWSQPDEVVYIDAAFVKELSTDRLLIQILKKEFRGQEIIEVPQVFIWNITLNHIEEISFQEAQKLFLKLAVLESKTQKFDEHAFDSQINYEETYPTSTRDKRRDIRKINTIRYLFLPNAIVELYADGRLTLGGQVINLPTYSDTAGEWAKAMDAYIIDSAHFLVKAECLDASRFLDGPSPNGEAWYLVFAAPDNGRKAYANKVLWGRGIQATKPCHFGQFMVIAVTAGLNQNVSYIAGIGVDSNALEQLNCSSHQKTIFVLLDLKAIAENPKAGILHCMHKNFRVDQIQLLPNKKLCLLDYQRNVTRTMSANFFLKMFNNHRRHFAADTSTFQYRP